MFISETESIERVYTYTLYTSLRRKYGDGWCSIFALPNPFTNKICLNQTVRENEGGRDKERTMREYEKRKNDC